MGRQIQLLTNAPQDIDPNSGKRREAKGARELTLEALLAPETVDRFKESFLGKAPFSIRRGDEEYYSRLRCPTLRDFDRLLVSATFLCPDYLNMVAGEANLERSRYSDEHGHAQIDSVMGLFIDGATIILNSVDVRDEQLSALCNDVERELGCRTQINAYITPANSQGFLPHSDDHDVLILQVYGEKWWSVYDTPTPVPLPHQAVRSRDPISKTYISRAPEEDIILAAGDLLFIPRGLIHAAQTGAQPSLHLTLGLHDFTWAHVLGQALVDQADINTALRQRAQLDCDEATTRLFLEDVLTTVCRSLGPEAIRAILQKMAAPRDRPLHGQLSGICESSYLTAQTLLIRRRYPALTLSIDTKATPEGTVSVSWREKDIIFPKKAEAALAVALSGMAFRVGDLPGLDLAGRITLAALLMKDGVLVSANVSCGVSIA